MKAQNLIFLVLLLTLFQQISAQPTTVSLYRTFERSIENDNSYSNKFSDVELKCTYTSPSGQSTDFFGFFDGDGSGGGNAVTGNVWKIRFMPNELGEWKYTWQWSDSSTGGEGSFICDSINAGKGILQAYNDNPRWLAYNGTDPVWLKSYYESGHGSIAQPLDWLAENVYQVLISQGYNHFQVNWLLSLCCFGQYYTDGPTQSTTDLTLYTEGKASGTMNLNVWKLMEQNVNWLNERNIGLHMFLGFDGGRNDGPAWEKLSEEEKDYYVKYVVSRLAPYANIAAWNFVWEVEGNRETHELGWARLVQKYDVFNHLRAYQDEKPKYNEYHRPEYNFACVENHRIHSDDREPQYWSAPWTHHQACLMGYVPGKPVYMMEGNALWRRYWAAKVQKETGKAPNLDEVRQAAWACVTAGASFNWCGHQGEGNLTSSGPQGLPFHGDENTYSPIALQFDILADVMNNHLEFYKMNPADELLSQHDSLAVWCLAQPGEQYLVFTTEGKPFHLKLKAGEYQNNQWLSTITGAGVKIPAFSASENETLSFTPPNSDIDWVLLLRKTGEQKLLKEAYFNAAEIDSTGSKLTVNCNNEIIIPDGYKYSFEVKEKGSSKVFEIAKITSDVSNKKNIFIELNSKIVSQQNIVMSYMGTLLSNDGLIFESIKELEVENNSKMEFATCISGQTDASGNFVTVNCSKEVLIPEGSKSGFTIKDKNSAKIYFVKSIKTDTADDKKLILELYTTIPANIEIVLTYNAEKGNYRATDGNMLTSVYEMDIENNSTYGTVSVNTIPETEFKLYPNPATNHLEIKRNETIQRIQVFNVLGISVLDQRNVDKSSLNIDTGQLPAGKYLVSITTTHETIVKSFVKK